MKVSVRELKNRLSEYLRRAEAGEEIEVLSRNRPVARLVPATSAAGEVASEEAAIRRIRGLPWLRPACRGKTTPVTPVVSIGAGERSLSEIVNEQRG